MVSQRMVRIGDTDLGIRPVGFFTAHHERAHAGEIGLEGKHLQVVHDLCMFLECVWNTGWPINGRQLT